LYSESFFEKFSEVYPECRLQGIDTEQNKMLIATFIVDPTNTTFHQNPLSGFLEMNIMRTDRHIDVSFPLCILVIYFVQGTYKNDVIYWNTSVSHHEKFNAWNNFTGSIVVINLHT
jgi:hypothetical protein